MSLKRSVTAHGGYGLALLMVFLASTILVGVSFQLVTTPSTIAHVGSSSQDNLAAKELALVGLDETEVDIRTKLQAGTSITTSYRYPASGTNPVSAPSDPTNLASSGVQVGSYYATIPQARGNSYLIKVTATVGGATVEQTRLILANKVTATPTTFDCSVIETQILAGNIASISDADLITWAQNNCMIKTASVTVTAPSAGTAANACGTYTGSGTLNPAALSACSLYAHGTYSTIQFASPTSISSNSTLHSLPSSGTLRTVHVPGTVASGSTFSADSGGVQSTIAHTFLFNTLTNTVWIYGSTASDNVMVSGDANFSTYLREGDNNIMITGTWGVTSSQAGKEIKMGEGYSSGVNSTYINSITNVLGTSVAQINTFASTSAGLSRLYFNNLLGGQFQFSGASGNDIVGCGVSFTGGTGTCGTINSSGNYTFYPGTGSDIVSIDTLPSSMSIDGAAGSNIIYTKGCGPSTAVYNTGSTTSLVISGGDRSGTCTLNSGGGNSVLMKKSGSLDNGFSSSGFGRTLTY